MHSLEFFSRLFHHGNFIMAILEAISSWAYFTMGSFHPLFISPSAQFTMSYFRHAQNSWMNLKCSNSIDCGQTKKNAISKILLFAKSHTNTRGNLFLTERYTCNRLSLGFGSSCTRNGSLFIIFTVINSVSLRWLSMFRFDNAANCYFLYMMCLLSL